MLFHEGDKVFIEESAQTDIGFQAWSFVKANPYATVKRRLDSGKVTDAKAQVYALEWDDEFSGGIPCLGACAPHRGQFVTAKHLALDFEASRLVCTVPQIEAPQDY